MAILTGSIRLNRALECLTSFPPPEEFPELAKDVGPDWISAALHATGTATLRKRRLPVEQVPWLVIGMALYRDRPITEVVNKLDLAMPDSSRPTVAPSAVVQARDRLGEAPMAWLFGQTAHVWGHESARAESWRGLSVYGVDGTTLRVPDSDENREHFGLWSGARGESGYPMVRLACLMALRSHLLVAASFGPYGRSEHSYAEDLWPCLPDDSLVILDKGFFAANILIPITEMGRNHHWLTRAKSKAAYRVVKQIRPGDELVEFNVSAQALEKNPSLPRTWLVRRVEYQRKGFRPQALLTSLLDPTSHPAKELVEMYHERWEIELGYDEVKTKMLDSVPLRSKSVDRVRQELWGVLLAYNLVRLEIARVADDAGVPSIRISFVSVFRMICDEWLWNAGASPGAIPRHLRRLRENIALFIVPPRRGERSYPRAVKIKMSNYPRKRRAAAYPRKRSR